MSRRRTGIAAPLSTFVRSPLNYAGNKTRLLHLMLPHMDTDGRTFVDLFAGGLNVGLNVRGAAGWVFNDAHPVAFRMADLFTNVPHECIVSGVEQIIAEYGFPDTVAYGYEHYGGDSSRGVPEAVKLAYLRLRYDYNTGLFTGVEKQLVEFALIIFGYNNQIGTTLTGGWRNSSGKRDFNTSVRRNLEATTARIQTIQPTLSQHCFTGVPVLDYERPFLYADPPYLLGSTTYNQHENGGWDDADERRLLDFLDAHHATGTPFALSNVIQHKGETNTMLADWVEKRGHDMIVFDGHAYPHTPRRKHGNDTGTVEVLVVSA